MDNKDILANILSTTSEIKGKLQTINDNLTNLNTECLPACEQGVELGLANTVIANLEEKKLIHSRISECGKAVWEIEKAFTISGMILYLFSNRDLIRLRRSLSQPRVSRHLTASIKFRNL